MRHILCISFYGAAWGGSFIPSLLALEKEAVRAKVGITFVFPKMGEMLPWAEFFPHAIWLNNEFFIGKRCSLKVVGQLLKIMHLNHITDVVTNFLGYNRALRMVRLIHGGGYSQVVHNTFHKPSANWLKRKFKLLLLERTYDRFIGVSEWVACSLEENGLPARRIKWVNNAIDFKRLEKWEKEELRRDRSEVVVFMMGWPYYVKGVDVALRAIKKLREEGIDVVLLMPHKNVLNDLIQDAGELPSFIRFVNAREDVATFYNNADIFLSASREEGFGFAIAEATMSNCIVLCSDIPPVVTIGIPHNILFKSGNVDDLCDKLRYCIENKQSLLAYKTEQQQYVKKVCDMEKWANTMLYMVLQANNKI